MPDGRVQFDDADARELADRLWEAARRVGGTAMLAVAIDSELRRTEVIREPIEVPEHAAAGLREVLRETPEESVPPVSNPDRTA